MKEEKPIYLDQKGYEAFLASIEKVQAEIKANSLVRKELLNSDLGWGLPELREVDSKNTILNKELRKKYEQLQRIVIVEKQNDENIIDIGDIVCADIEYSIDDKEEFMFRLVGSSGNMFAELPEISINCPLGNAIYNKKVGDTCSYTVEDNKVLVLIKEKVNELDNQKRLVK